MSTSKAPLPSFTKTWHSTSYGAIDPKRPELSMKGRNVIITGAGSGIGARTAQSFAAAGAANIALIGRRADMLERTKLSVQEKFPGISVSAFPADVTDAKAIEHAFKTFSGAAGQVHVLVNGAGYLSAAASAVSADLDDFFRDVDTNVKGSVIVFKAFAQIATADPAVINLVSLLTFNKMVPNFSAYAASKAATVRFFDAVQAENPQWQVFNLHPGMVDTDVSRKSGYPSFDDRR
jgi:NAD(P)-dependent dehydrogenase (short-subunit alcohol dehydrogenase family)